MSRDNAQQSIPPRRVLITGALGNLGQKLIARLSNCAWCQEIVGVDRLPASQPQLPAKVKVVIADLTDPHDTRWRQPVRDVDAVVHLAAQNPYPNAPWDDAIASFDMTARLVEAAGQSGVTRLVFASSNHVMGRYKDSPLFETVSPGKLSTDLVPGPGTRLFDGRKIMDEAGYAVAKLMGERLCCAKSESSDGKLTAVSLRIGWCQPGENHPRTMNPFAIPQAEAGSGQDEENSDLKWFRNMWLSNRDFGQLVERALTADASHWNAPGIVVNGMSGNTGMLWDIETTRRMIGYAPQDNAWKELGKTAGRS